MQINTSRETLKFDATETAKNQAVAGSDSSPPADGATVTLSDEARRLADESAQLTDALAGLVSPPGHASIADEKKKKHVSALPLLDVDAMRLIRDKLRAQNLNVPEPTPTEKEIKTDKTEQGLIQL